MAKLRNTIESFLGSLHHPRAIERAAKAAIRSRLYSPAKDEVKLGEIISRLAKNEEEIAERLVDMTEVAMRLHAFYYSKKEISKTEQLSRKMFHAVGDVLERNKSGDISLADEDKLRTETLTRFWEGIAKADVHAVNFAKQEKEHALKEKAEAHIREGKYDEAIKVLQVMVEEKGKTKDIPAMVATLRNIADVMRKKGDSKGSLDYSQKAAEIDPSAWFDVGFILGETKQYRKSIAAYNRLLRKAPNNANAWNNKGWAYENLLDFSRALKCYEKALTFNSRLVRSWEGKGLMLWKLGHLEQASNSFEEALKIEPSNQYVLINLTALYNDGLKNYKKAFDYARLALDVNPYDPIARSNLAEILVLAHRYKEARDHAKKVLESDNDASRKIAMYFTISLCYFFEGNIKEGTKYLKAVKDYRRSLQPTFTNEWSYDGISDFITNSDIPKDCKTNLLETIDSMDT